MNIIPRVAGLVLVAGTLPGLVAGAAHAQAFPSKPMRLIVPFPAGGATDIVGRLLAQKLSETLGQPVVVDNRGGAGGTIGSDLAARAAPDGHVLLLGTSSTHAVAPALYARLPYDPVRDFSPVTLAASATILLAVHPSIPAKDVRGLIALARQRPGALAFASSDKGDTPALADLAGGQVALMFGTAVSFLPYVKSGRLKALAVTNPKRSAIMPDVPTVAESGLPGFDALQWFGVFAPAGTPRDVITRLNGDLVKILRMPDVRDTLANLGAEVVGNTPEQFAEFQRTDAAKWAKVVKASGARID
jgi:tripartite-type tricarboxylate transporter receptor subunit TctC